MVQYVKDKTGRFAERPHYEPKELDRECEQIITAFLKEKYGDARFPVSTEDLTVLIERDTDDFDPYADLSKYGPEVEGVTEFRPGSKPRVKISAHLGSDDRRENRLRTTLTHEYGHVRLHSYLWDMDPSRPDLLKRKPDANKQICKRDSILDAKTVDWMEWQAGYACGAFLMPYTHIRRLVSEYNEKHGLFGAVQTSGVHGRALIDLIQNAFQVSADAARIRLIKLGILGASDASPSLFTR